MEINLFVGNHFPECRPSLQDHVLWVGEGLQALGHEVKVSDTKMDPDCVNLMWEFFLPPIADAVVDSGCRYGIICTEHLSGNGFNGKNGETNWKIRYQGFAKAATAAEFVWTLFPRDVDQARKHAPASHLELGFVPSLVVDDNVEPDFDFAFFGKRTKERMALLCELQEQGYRCAIPCGFQPRPHYERLMRRSAVHLDAASYNNIPMPSVAKIGRAVHARRSVAIGKTKYTTEPASFFPQHRRGAFVDFAIKRLETWREDADYAFNELTKRPMTECLTRAFDEVNDAKDRRAA